MTDNDTLIIGLGIGILAGVMLSAYSVTTKYCKICDAYPQKCAIRTPPKKIK
jgi:hypothetical protein